MNLRKAVKTLERRRAHIECLIEDDDFHSDEQANWVKAESAALKVLIALGREKMAEQSDAGEAQPVREAS